MVARGGGASLLLFVPRAAALSALRADWVAVHELSHLLHPFVERDDAWLSEGLATYYQELLRVRAGLLSEQDAWRRIVAGARRVDDAEHSLADEAASMYESFEFARVYWGGATFALLADVELRRRTRGALTLDHVIAALHECCAHSTQPWSARDLLARMDALAGISVFTELAERHVFRPGFPDLEPVLRGLGVTLDDAKVRFDASAPEASLRAAIMAAAPSR
jgi:predicted metalloprotease with PDZ domain